MKLKFITTKKYTGNIKCAIHLSGKLGFSQAAIEHLKISENKYIAIGINEEDKRDTSLYLKIFPAQTEDTFKVIKAGNYFYLNTKKMFDDMGIDYTRKNIIYDIIEIEYEGEQIYKLIRREYDRKNKQ